MKCIFFLNSIFFVFAALAQQTTLSVQTGHSGPINCLAYSPDDQIIASGGADNNVILWDVNSGKQMNILSGHKDEVVAIHFHPEKNWLATASLDGSVKIFEYPNGMEIKTVDFEDEVGSISFYNSGKDLFVGTQVVSSVDMVNFQVSEITSDRGSRIDVVAVSPNNKLLATGGKNRKSKVIDLETSNILAEYHISAHHLVFDSTNNYLYGGAPNGKYFRKSIYKKDNFEVKSNRIWKNFYDVDISNNFLVAANRDGQISVYDILKNRIKYNLNSHDGQVRALVLSNSSGFLASAGTDKIIRIWDLSSGKLSRTLSGTGNRINDIVFSDDGEHLYLAYENGSFKKSHLSPNGFTLSNQIELGKFTELIAPNASISIDSIMSFNTNNVEFWASKKWASKTQGFYKKRQPMVISWDLASNECISSKTRKDKLIKTKGRKNKIKYFKNIYPFKPKFDAQSTDIDRKLFAYIKENELILQDLNSKKELFSANTNHTDAVSSIAFNPKHEMIATSSWDGTVKFWDFKGDQLVSYSTSGDKDFIFVDPDNHYFATKGALENVGFLFNNRILSFDQFDLIYNRPDIVFGRLTHIDDEFVLNYSRAYNKRLQKLGIRPEELRVSDDIPEMTYNTNHQISTKINTLKINVSAQDEESDLDKFYLSVNGVPSQGEEGFDITSGKRWHGQIEIELSSGLNEIQLYVRNKSGISSLKETFNITYSGSGIQPDLYLVTIGASEYQQSAYNLKYAAKDAIDIANQFGESKLFNEIKTLTITDAEFKLESLGKIKSFISAASVDDVVLLSIAGHGVLDSNLDYYLATYDVDFSNPSERGLSYDQLESLLSQTKSRKKSLFIDACHSGELDKDEVTLAYNESTEFGDVIFRNVGATVTQKTSMSLQSSFDLSKSLFADMRDSNGSTVISSAGGAEYAMEGSEWNNGVFTFCLLKGLKDGSADLDGNNKIMLSELQEYIFEQVTKMTGGRQKPTSRVENLKSDFRIW
ncbi:WD40 repeat [Reichenbachiella faecimaris]|uniref:WD40 repeat n=1 Tax=Reichenbachiella faecimaris TaxID=692418 RepID=A0A1W2G7E6_REIFA|nr:caspase family protein [Reichenbachiella faecimaris]SMD32521.1 WD40 repeat [Reichenbachiella faecimaris]